MIRALNLVLILLAALSACDDGARPPPDAGTAVNAGALGDRVDADSHSRAVAPGQPVTLYDPAAVAWAVNIGGEAHRSPEGIEFQADDGSDDSRTGSFDTVTGTQDPVPFQSYRRGELRFRKALPNGRYDLTLYFSEPDDIAAGERLFTVLAQGEPVIRELDVRAARDDTARSALTRTVPGVDVTDGELTIALQSDRGEPILNALVVRAREPDTRRWAPFWSDEFDYEGSPDPALWDIRVWEARRVNRENQAYTDRLRNVRVADGRLVIEAHKESYEGAAYTSGRIRSRGKGDWLYGRVDIRARLAGGRGTWSALWMMPSDGFRYATHCSADPDNWQGTKDCDAWPNSGEIDIMEHVGYDMTRLHGTVHNKAYYWKNDQQRKGSVEASGLDEAYHVFTLVWTPDRLTIYFEGTPYFFYHNDGTGWESWPYDHPYHMVLNLAIGGGWGGAGGPIDDGIFPVSLEVDYVRIFKPVAN